MPLGDDKGGQWVECVEMEGLTFLGGFGGFGGGFNGCRGLTFSPCLSSGFIFLLGVKKS